MKSIQRQPIADSGDSSGAVATLAALAQPTRLALFRLLLEHEPSGLTPGAIAAKLGLAPATLSFHLKELASTGLVVDRRESRFIWYRANIAAVENLVGYLTENCCRATRGGHRAPACAPGTCAPSTSRKGKSA
ncbi:MAG TPA: metalloregulator ArsR/SmtB family transcription factor [Casimicrobiaceae bacterium]|nr:metalloregulator ArsR/SmtB family transcription factor [Casimicrobiaceae bacterium]